MEIKITFYLDTEEAPMIHLLKRERASVCLNSTYKSGNGFDTIEAFNSNQDFQSV